MDISMLLDMAADGFGDRTVLGGAADGLTAAQLRGAARSGGAQAAGSGAESLVYLATNGPAFPVALFAAAAAGIPFVPVNYRLGVEQLRKVLARHRNSWVIADPGQQAHLEGIETRAVLTPGEWLAKTAHPEAAEIPSAGVDPAVIIYTSGTTSAPKGVLLRHDNLVSYVIGSVEFAAAESDEASLMCVPPYHIAAVSNVLTSLYSGRRLIMLDAFSPSSWLDLVRAERITTAMVVPTMLARLMEADVVDRTVPTLRTLAYGGAPMPARWIEQALIEWPQVGFVNAYGLTETSSTVSVLGPEEHRVAIESEDPAVRARLSSAGRPLPGVELVIRDGEGRDVPVGVRGRICVRGAQVSGMYDSDPAAGADDEGGHWFDTRDVGRLDADGFLFIEGRDDDTIIRGAENIAPAEIEDVLIALPGVTDAGVVGVPDEEWGHRIEAVVVLAPGTGFEPEVLRDRLRERLRSSKTPDRIVEWSEIPRTVTGKILRSEIRTELTSS